MDACVSFGGGDLRIRVCMCGSCVCVCVCVCVRVMAEVKHGKSGPRE